MLSTARSLSDRIALLLSTGFCTGFVRWAPGTVGSVWGLLLSWGLQRLLFPWWGNGLVLSVLFLLGVPLCRRASVLLQSSDPGPVIYDEIIAVPVVFLVDGVTMENALLGFLWFRLFDILKPWPIRRFERLPNGWGIMVDDLLAAVFAAVALRLTLLLLPG